MTRRQQEPRVGIWWFWKGRIYDYSVPLSEAEEACGYSNGSIGHYDAWPVMQKAFPELADFDYTDIPRGQIVAINRKEFILYASREFLAGKKEVDAVLGKFQLDKSATTLRPDEHYEKTTCLKELPQPQASKGYR